MRRGLTAVRGGAATSHEFDPYFNFRVTKFITERGLYEFWNWFDLRTWYPLGRIVGGTTYPGLLYTAAGFWKVLNALNFPVSIKDCCVFTAPIFRWVPPLRPGAPGPAASARPGG